MILIIVIHDSVMIKSWIIDIPVVPHKAVAEVSE